MPALQEDEIILIVVGGILGAACGAVQLRMGWGGPTAAARLAKGVQGAVAKAGKGALGTAGRAAAGAGSARGPRKAGAAALVAVAAAGAGGVGLASHAAGPNAAAHFSTTGVDVEARAGRAGHGASDPVPVPGHGPRGMVAAHECARERSGSCAEPCEECMAAQCSGCPLCCPEPCEECSSGVGALAPDPAGGPRCSVAAGDSPQLF